jgi:hypothetical protein
MITTKMNLQMGMALFDDSWSALGHDPAISEPLEPKINGGKIVHTAVVYQNQVLLRLRHAVHSMLV